MKLPGGTGAELAGRIDAPSEPPRAAVLMLHAFGSSKDLKSSTRIAGALAEAGFFVLRIDFTGVGQSGGDFAQTTFTSHVADALAAVEWMRRELAGGHAGSAAVEVGSAGAGASDVPQGAVPIFLVGHSLGALVAVRAAHSMGDCHGVVLLGASASTAHLANILVGRSPEILSDGEGEVETLGKRVRVGRSMIEELRAHDALADLKALVPEVFIIHSRADEVAPVDHAMQLFDAARSPKSLMILEGADHLLLRREQDGRFVGNVIAAWATGL